MVDYPTLQLVYDQGEKLKANCLLVNNTAHNCTTALGCKSVSLDQMFNDDYLAVKVKYSLLSYSTNLVNR